MRRIILSLSASLLTLGITLAPFALARPDGPPPIVQGKERPILLQRMVVSATAL